MNKARKANRLFPFWKSITEFVLQFPSKELFIFTKGEDQKKEGEPTISVTGADIARQTRLLGSVLQKVLRPQEKALLLFPQGLENIYSLLACWYANIIAIPMPLTDLADRENVVEKLLPVLEDSGATCILSNAMILGLVKENQALQSVHLIDIHEIFKEGAERSRELHKERKKSPGDMAIYLYTSGSTSQPKGVMITHANILSQAVMGAEQWSISGESHVVSWMPQFHNFGLCFGILAPLLKGACCIVLPPEHFVRNPAYWFKCVDRYRATHTAAPNFAFDYCCTAIDPVLDFPERPLSLQSLKALICGGEPVSQQTYKQFLAKFEPFGLDGRVFCPHYGLSETGSVVTKKPGTSMRFVSLAIDTLKKGRVKHSNRTTGVKVATSCGEVNKGVHVKIVNPKTCQSCASDQIGEIWVKSPSVAAGYTIGGKESKNVFSGRIRDTREKGFLRTGDLGFIDDGHLYIVGREKEVIIVHGKNHYPVDIEWTLKKIIPRLTLPGIAFAHEMEGQEAVVLVQEIDNSAQPLCSELAVEMVTALSDHHRLGVYEIVFVQKNSIPRTGSGKIQRQACKRHYAEGTLSVLYRYREGEVEPQTSVGSTDNRTTEKSAGPKRREYPARLDQTLPPTESHFGGVKYRDVSHEKVQNILEKLKRDVLMAELRLDPQRLRNTQMFSELGLNSIQYVRISKRIEAVFNILFAPVMLFKHRRLEDLAFYLSEEISNINLAPALAVQESTPTEAAMVSSQCDENRIKFNPDDYTDQAVAIIGMSCRFPGGATDPESFWRNLLEQKDCITPIHESRPMVLADTQAGDFPDWGGFLEKIEAFDAEFFKLSPLEAQSMDPQQRKMLELVWSVIENGGYSPRQLAGESVGLFVGVHNGDYAELVARDPRLMDTYGAYLDSGLHMSMIANRVSRYLDFHGPSEVINTACSSSLVAVHHAVESIARGSSALAVVGGINLIFTSRVYRASDKAGMLSPGGRCKTFDQRADGFVRAEGYGAVLLKPYGEAVKDNDTVCAVIRSTVINHDGESDSLRAPNIQSQKKLIQSAYLQARLPPETISYIEAHGTGTALGDPIEVQALKEAFQEINPNIPEAFCGLGTVKTNIGHCESAAGMAGLIKVLLAMKYKTLPGLVHFENLSHFVPLQNSPFYIVGKNREWRRLTNAQGREVPRRAGISSFGFGGANAHLVVEEFMATPTGKIAQRPLAAHLIPLSAKNSERLTEYANQLLIYFHRDLTESLVNISYTLQLGRQAMEERVAFLVESKAELIQRLEQFVEGRRNIANCYRGGSEEKTETIRLFNTDHTLKAAVDGWLQKREFGILGKIWASGVDINWRALYTEHKPKRVALPTYPFAENVYWLSGDTHSGIGVTQSGLVNSLHPLLHQNRSDFYQQRFVSTFSGKEFFLADHQIQGEKVLPGAACLEMARVAVEQATGGKGKANTVLQFKNIVWARPIVVNDQAREVYIKLKAGENAEIEYEIYTHAQNREDSESCVHSEGMITIDNFESPLPLDLPKLRADIRKARFAAEQCYQAFNVAGVNYGPAHRCIKTLYTGHNQVLAELLLPASLSHSAGQFILHPALVDSALQAGIGLTLQGDTIASIEPRLPFALDALELYAPCTATLWAWLRYSHPEQSGAVQPRDGLQKLDIDLCDQHGSVCVRLRGLSMRTLKQSEISVPNDHAAGVLCCRPIWKNTRVEPSDLSRCSRHMVILCAMAPFSPEAVQAEITGRLKQNPLNTVCTALDARQTDLAQGYQEIAIGLFKILKRLIEEKSGNSVLVQVLVPTDEATRLLTGLSGLVKTARLENPQVVAQLIEIGSIETQTQQNLCEKVLENTLRCEDIHIRYQRGMRQVAYWEEIPPLEGAALVPWKNDGIYLITGGTGGLGLIFAREIAAKTEKATLILAGRSALDAQKQSLLQQIEFLGCKLDYRQVDVSQPEEVSALIQSILKDYGALQGILHSAGVIRDNYILKKTPEEFHQVFAPKVAGVINLDRVSKDIDLDFFVCFSSIAGALGNPSQADYAAANAFMDAYADYRNQLVGLNQRRGKTLSINWPLWKEGSMQPGWATEAVLEQTTGMVAMNSHTGIEALIGGLGSSDSQQLVIEGNLQRLRAFLFNNCIATKDIVRQTNLEPLSPPIGTWSWAGEKNQTMEKSIAHKAIEYFKALLSSTLKLPVQRIRGEEPLETYGIDSVMVIQLTERLEKVFGSLSKTLFFEYKTLQEITDYFLRAHAKTLREVLQVNEAVPAPTSVDAVAELSHDAGEHRAKRQLRFSRAAASPPPDIAVIGLAGRYPQARNLDQYWQNLRDGKNCITEVPSERWNWREYYSEDKTRSGVHTSKWGGFIDDVDKFDPLFFNISPREAELLDPQERLFLETAWAALEDAGYCRETLSTQVGVYAGVMYGEYQLLGAEASMRGNRRGFAGTLASIANRVSYVLNLHGPSMTVDTMCSGSLTAIHLACQDLNQGRTELGLAGGVNITIHPNKYFLLSQGQFISSKGRCASFGEGGDGYIPGEGVGVALLKRLADAERDGDHIYGVIKGTVVNHGGKTNGYTVPNPRAQQMAITGALKEARIDPRSVSYIEAHGTGTKLGDPIEIMGLTKAFKTDDKQYCWIGSVKSNIGHCESAAGIAGVTKVLLQMQYGKIAPSLHSQVLNPYIDFTSTPFVVNHELRDWGNPVINGKTSPRIAGISSFGAGGSNSHVVIEEYVTSHEADILDGKCSYVVLLSARSERQLLEYAESLLTFLQSERESSRASAINLANIAYTLQVGRDAMGERLGFIVDSMRDLMEKLRAFVADPAHLNDGYRGQVRPHQETFAMFSTDEDMAIAVDSWVKKHKYTELLQLWVKGGVVEWNKLYGKRKPRRISLPTYPFARERYWVEFADQHRGESILSGVADREAVRLTFSNFKTNESSNVKLYENIFDDVISGDISVDAAIKEIKSAMYR